MPNVLAGCSIDVKRSTPPNIDELEISVFGPGYGECIVAHLGGNQWLIVDSCVGANNQPVAIDYLQSLGVQIVSDVKLIVATHWHDDHFAGISRVLAAAPDAEFVVSASIREKQFLSLLQALQTNASPGSTGVDEWGKLIQFLQNRKNAGKGDLLKWVVGERTLFSRPAGGGGPLPPCTVQALSPSDVSFAAACEKFAEMFPANKSLKQRVIPSGPNHTSIVLSLSFGGIDVLLGADLENTTVAHTGWSVIASSTTRPLCSASVFKIPHHGSENGHSDDVWSRMVTPGSAAIITPYINGRVSLPLDRDIARIKGRAGSCYLTAPTTPKAVKPKSNDPLNSQVLATVKSIHSISAAGHVRLRYSSQRGWSRGLFGTAEEA